MNSELFLILCLQLTWFSRGVWRRLSGDESTGAADFEDASGAFAGAVDVVAAVDARRVIVVVVDAAHRSLLALAQPAALEALPAGQGAPHPVHRVLGRRGVVVGAVGAGASAEPAHYQGAHAAEGARVLHHVLGLQQVVQLRVLVVQGVVQVHVVEHQVAILLALKHKHTQILDSASK